jgi:hypothetical protein
MLVVKPKRKIPPGRPGCSWEDNTKMDLKKIGCEGVWVVFIWLR